MTGVEKAPLSDSVAAGLYIQTLWFYGLGSGASL